MTTQQQAYIIGFVKRANEYGFSDQEALGILKEASELKGNQYKLDVDKDGKIEASDLKKLRQRKQAEELKGNQRKLDVNKNGKIDADDLKKLRQHKKADFLGDLKTKYNNYVDSKNKPTPEDIAANARARQNYTRDMRAGKTTSTGTLSGGTASAVPVKSPGGATAVRPASVR